MAFSYARVGVALAMRVDDVSLDEVKRIRV